MSENWDNDENFEDLFKNRLDDFESEPPQEAWEFIAQHIQPKKTFWQSKKMLLLSLNLLVIGSIYLVSDSKIKTLLNSPQSIAHSPRLNSNSITKNNPENPVIRSENKIKVNSDSNAIKKSQNIDNQLVKKNSPENPVIRSENKIKVNSDSNAIKKSQNIDNQLVKKNSPENPVIRSENKIKVNSDSNAIKKSQNTGNQLVKKENPVIWSENKIKIISDSNAIKKSQNIDNQLVKKENPVILSENKIKIILDSNAIKKSQNTGNQLVKKENPVIWSENKIKIISDSNAIKKSQNTDNQAITKSNPENSVILSKNIIETQNSLSTVEISNRNFPTQKLRLSQPLYVGIYFSPIYTFRQIKPNQNDNLVITQLSPENTFARQNTGFLLGLNIEKIIHSRWQIFAGFSFLQMKTSDNYTYYRGDSINYTISTFNTNAMTVSPHYTIHQNQFQAKYQNLTAQLGTKFYLGGKRISQNLRFGIGYNLLINKQMYSQENFDTTHRQGNIFINLGYEFKFHLMDRLGLTVEPNWQYYLQTLYKNNAIYQVQPSNLGVRIGFLYQIR